VRGYHKSQQQQHHSKSDTCYKFIDPSSLNNPNDLISSLHPSKNNESSKIVEEGERDDDDKNCDETTVFGISNGSNLNDFRNWEKVKVGCDLISNISSSFFDDDNQNSSKTDEEGDIEEELSLEEEINEVWFFVLFQCLIQFVCF